ncbi:MAG: glycosyltransferase family 4 protein [Stenomitos rutilans HA7619-LM2]|jgi:glycosyltransferase involved in cell wall biosynthesis|nr:glycosyltransferase family 4 protein [Stenomitos rutilans HA7619-LM2]
MRVLIITSATVCGGAEAYALTIAQAAAQSGWETHAAFPLADATASLRHEMTAHHVTYHSLEIAEPLSRGIRAMGDAFVRWWRTRSLLLTLKPDVVLINLPWADHCLGSILACGQLRVPTAVMFHLIPPEKIPLSRSRRQLYTWARNRGQQWLTNSTTNCCLLAELFEMSADDLQFIYNGITLPALEDCTPEKRAMLRQAVRQELGIPSSTRLLLTVGRLAPQKGYTDLLAIIPSVLADHPDTRFVWAGAGEQQQELHDRLREAEIDHAVLMLGHRTDLPRLLQAADLFVFPTRFEGHPFALLEAMAYRLPIVTTNASSIPEFIEHREQGLLCPVGDSKALLHTLHWALQHPKQMQQMAEKANQHVNHFSQEHMLEQTLNRLQTLAFLTKKESNPTTARNRALEPVVKEQKRC